MSKVNISPQTLPVSAVAAAALAAPAAVTFSNHRAALALTLLMGLQPIACDVYLPAMPAIGNAFGAGMSAVQMTMAAMMLAFGFGQLVWGPVADRVGRKPVLLLGLLLFTAAGLACTLAGSIEALIFWRAVQGACLASAVVVSRALLRDLYEPTQAAHVMALGFTGLGLVAILGPVVGGLATAWWGWRATMAIVAVCGAVALVYVATALPETLAVKNPRATQLRPLLATWRGIARHPRFRAWALLITCTFAGLFTMLVGSAFVYIQLLGLSASAFGLVLASCSLSYVGGTFLCRHWIATRGVVGAVRLGSLFSLAGGVGMLLFLLAGFHTVWALLVPQWLYCMGHGVHQPCGQSGVVAPFKDSAGAASALAGFVLAIAAFGISTLLGQVTGAGHSHGAWPMVLGIALAGVATCVVAFTWVPRAHQQAAAVAAVV